MKKLITLLLTLFSLISYGQTELDKEIFRLVNEYRVSNDLMAWEWDQDVFNVAKKHNTYQVKTNTMSHYEPVNTRVGSRLTAGNIDWWASGENLARITSTGLTTKQIAVRTVNGWKTSPGHNWLLLGPDSYYQYVGISSKVKTNYTYITLNVCK